MTSQKNWSSASALCSIFLLLPPGLCHMEMSWPYPLRSKFNTANGYQNVDYSMTSPLSQDGSNYPCKGYQNDGPTEPVITYTAGSTYNLSLSGSATHGGGSCQLSLSYDNGATFRVIKSMMGSCPLKDTYDFTIPSYMPAGGALLAWSWQNKVGNREFYMNCAAVSIESGYSSRKRRHEAANSFHALPYIWRANLAGVDDCATSEGSDPVYPNPGPDVEYGDDVTVDSQPSPGECDSPLRGDRINQRGGDPQDSLVSHAYEPTSDAEAATETAYSPALNAIYQPPAPVETASQVEGSEREYSGPDFNGQARVFQATTTQASYSFTSLPTYPTMTVFADCPDTITLTIYPSPTTTTSSRWTWSTTRSTTWTTRTGRPASQPSSPPPPPPNNRPSYVTGNPNGYLPCVPGTFMCTSEDAWLTCNWNDDDSGWVYGNSRAVAGGMICLPALSPYSGETDQYKQQALTPAGFYRDDRYVRARPDGDCDRDGSILCTDGGQQFDVCDHGGWVRMGSVADGTICRNGAIVDNT